MERFMIHEVCNEFSFSLVTLFCNCVAVDPASQDKKDD